MNFKEVLTMLGYNTIDEELFDFKNFKGEIANKRGFISVYGKSNY